MGAFAILLFVLSLAGIIILFGLKAWEVRRAAIIAPELRRRADLRALEFKAQLDRARNVSSIIPFMILLGRYLVHEGARGFAHMAHLASVQSNQLADMVSHKHRFERQAPRSEFLRQVGERPAPRERLQPPAEQTPSAPVSQPVQPEQAAPNSIPPIEPIRHFAPIAPMKRPRRAMAPALARRKNDR